MTTEIDLKQIEEKTRASYFEDGFWDIGIGIYVVAIGFWVSRWASGLDAASQFVRASWVFLWWFLLTAGVAGPAIARRYITRPRMGQVKLRWMPSGSRSRKALYVTCLVISFLLISVGLASYDLIEIPDAAAGAIVGGGWLLFFGSFGCLWKYRLAYGFGLLMSVSAALHRSMDIQAGEIMMYSTGTLIAVIGLTKTVRFLRKYPKASVEDVDANQPG